jgi:hypothetical protein
MPPSLTAYVAPSGKALVAACVDGSLLPTNVISYTVSSSQSLKVQGASGTFTITFNGQTTSALAGGAAAATVQAALVALSSIGPANATVAGESPYQITFTGTLAGLPQNLFTLNTSGLSGTAAAQTLTAGSGSTVFKDSTVGANYANVGAAWVPASFTSGQGKKIAADGSGLNQAEWTVTGLAVAPARWISEIV